MAIDTQALAGQINNIFLQSLGRPASVDDIKYFGNAILSGSGTLADAQQAIASSPEAQQVQAGATGQTGTTTATATAASGGGGLLSGANIDSQALAGQINNIFLNKLGRAATVDDIKYFGNAILSGAGTLADAERDIGASKEAQGLLGTTKVDNTTKVGGTTTTGGTTKAGTDYSGQVNALFQKVFGRAADPTGLAYWGNLLAQGTSAADVEAGLRASAEGQSPATQQFQQGIRTVPFGSQLMGGNVQQMAQYAQPAAQAGPAMGAPSLQGFLGSNPAAAAMTPFQQSLQYQAALPSMIQPFNPADIPRTFQQTLSPTPRLDISSTTIPAWLQASIDAQNKKDGIEVSDLQKFNTANKVSTNSGLGTTTAGVTPGVTGNLAAGGIDPRIIQGYTQNLGRVADMPGAQYWQGLLSGGTPIADIYSGMAGSAEGLLYAQNQAAKAAANASTQYYNE
jgi:hypothetical protein